MLRPPSKFLTLNVVYFVYVHGQSREAIASLERSVSSISLKPQCLSRSLPHKAQRRDRNPGGRWAFQKEDPADVLREGGEELGLQLTKQQVFRFAVHAACNRDVRAKIDLSNDTHMDQLPGELAGLNNSLFNAHQCIDLVYMVVGFNDNPTTLAPGDTEEVLSVEMLNVFEPLPPLPISDDAALLQAYSTWLKAKNERNFFPIGW